MRSKQIRAVASGHRGFRTRPLILLVCAVAAATAACGDAAAPRAGDTVERYLRALAQSDAAAACVELAPSAQDDLARYVRSAFPELRDRGCRSVVTEAIKLSDPSQLAALTAVELRERERTGERAVIGLGDTGQVVQVSLRDGRWQISHLEFGR